MKSVYKISHPVLTNFFRIPLLLLLLSIKAISQSGNSGKPVNLPQEVQTLVLPEMPDRQPQNVIFILSDDHRYDFIGFTGKVPYLETPAMDRMARQGAHLQNAFVTTSLCSPSRASILTGQYTHHHGVVDNQTMVPDTTAFFPQYLQQAGYQTAFVGKWHMGHTSDEPRRGFDHWVSFKGQGQYYNPVLNENGSRVEYGDSTYITELLTDKAIDFLNVRDPQKPFFLYLSHKAVHAEFMPAPQDRGRYADQPVAYPKTMFPPGFQPPPGVGYHPRPSDIPDSSEYNYHDVPDWVKEQRYSWHGVDYMYHGTIPFDRFYHLYLETLVGLDRGIGRVLEYLESTGLLENTIVIYMGDNGFSFGEHGLIDKRHAYEESMRVPMLAYGGGIPARSKIPQMVQNIDVAPTILEFAGLTPPPQMDGQSFARLLKGETIPWRDKIFYEYFWERPFPQTPTTHAVRTDSFKYIRYHGIWDINELFNIKDDPLEAHNLIRDPQYQKLSEQLNLELFNWLKQTGGMRMELKPDEGARFDYKYRHTW